MYKMSLKCHIALLFIHLAKVLEWLVWPGTMPGVATQSGVERWGELDIVRELKDHV